MVIAKAIDGMLVPLGVAFVIGSLGWTSWVTWGIRQANNKLDSLATSLTALATTTSVNVATLEQHRIDDARQFATITTTLEERLNMLDFWRKVAEDRARMT